MDLYFVKRSTPSARVLAVLHELALPFAPHPLDVKGGENRTPAYLSLNPMGKVPTLVDGSVVVWESAAIAWYLGEKYAPGTLVPSTVEGRTELTKWLAFFTSHVNPAVGGVFYNTVGVRLFGRARDDQAFETGKKELARFLPVLDGQLAKTEYLVGSLTIADFLVAPSMLQLELAEESLAAYPHLEAWWRKLARRPSFVAAREAVGL